MWNGNRKTYFLKGVNILYKMYLIINISNINSIVKVPFAVLFDADH